MRILMMTNTYTPIVGGLERSIQSFSINLRQKGHKVLIMAPEYDGMPEKESNVLRVPAIKEFAKTPFSVHLPIPGIATKTVEAFQPDVIHAHHPFFLGDMALRMSSQHEIPLVFTYHTNFEDYTHMLPLDSEGIKKFLINLSAGFANMVDRVVVPSESIRRLLKRREVKAPTHVVPTGVDVEYYSKGDGRRWRNQLEIPEDAFVVGHLGRLSAEKNLGFLIEPLCGFLSSHPKAHALIVGKGPMQEKLELRLQEAGVAGRAHFPGVLKDQDAVDAYHAMDIFAFSSKSETQGMVVTEAMASGLPVVALDAPGVREVVSDKKNGRLLKKERTEDFLKALQWCADLNEKKRADLVEGAKETAGRFSKDRCTKKLLRVYRRAIKKTHTEISRKSWDEFFGRIDAELDLLKNLGKALQSTVK